jgi:hypothetical protein
MAEGGEETEAIDSKEVTEGEEGHKESEVPRGSDRPREHSGEEVEEIEELKGKGGRRGGARR